jgi:hypothetical protein
MMIGEPHNLFAFLGVRMMSPHYSDYGGRSAVRLRRSCFAVDEPGLQPTVSRSGAMVSQISEFTSSRAFRVAGPKAFAGANGGDLSYTHSGLYSMYALQESVRQMRGSAPAHIPGAKISVCHGVGGMCRLRHHHHVERGALSSEAASSQGIGHGAEHQPFPSARTQEGRAKLTISAKSCSVIHRR